MATRTERAEASAEVGPVNEARLVGRLSAAPVGKELPSGDTMFTFRVVVSRAPVPPRSGQRSRQVSDTIDCVVWGGRVKRTVARWSAGDVVEVSGAVRKRFFRAGGGTASRTEVEVTRGRLIRRAANG